MPSDPIKKLSDKYHLIIAMIAGLFLLGVLALLVNDYYSYKADAKMQTRARLAERAASVDAFLSQTKPALLAVQQWIEQELVSGLKNESLPRDHSAQTGIESSLTFNLKLVRILRTYNSILKNVKGFFYASKNTDQVTIFPPVKASNVNSVSMIKFARKLFEEKAAKGAVKYSDSQRIFSTTCLDDDKKTVLQIQLIGIYKNKELIGFVGVAVALKKMSALTAGFENHARSRFFILDEKHRVVARNFQCDKSKMLDDFASALGHYHKEPAFYISKTGEPGFAETQDIFIFSQPVKDTNWELVYVVTRQDFLRGFFSTFLKDMIAIAGVLVFLTAANYLIRKNFVLPSVALVKHIREEAETGDAEIPDVPATWLRWFRMISDTLPLRAVTANLPGAVFQVRWQDQALEVVFASERISDLLGISPAELTHSGSDLLELVQQEYKKIARDMFALSAKNLTPASLECPMWTAENQTVWVNLLAHPRFSSDSNIVWDGIMLDITKRKRTERALVRRDAILHAVSDAAERFLEISDWDQDTQKSMQDLGRVTNASRILLFKNTRAAGKLCATATQQWVDKSTADPLGAEMITAISYESGAFSCWREPLEKADTIVGPVEDLPDAPQAALRDQQVVSIAIVPVFAGRNWWGFLRLDDCRSAREWSGAELDALRAAVSVLGAAIERRATETELERARYRELDVGSRIQKQLLLGVVPEDIPRASIATLTIPTQQIDGDFTDFIKHDPRHIDMLIGDVMGKGVPAALLGAAIKSSVLQAISQLVCASNVTSLPTIEEIITTVHRKVCPQMISLRSFATMCYARFDLEKYRLDLIDAGHPNTIHFHKSCSKSTLLNSENMPIGFCENEVYQQHSYRIEPGDVLLFYSDGLMEAKNSAGEIFGVQRLSDLVEEFSHLEPDKILREIYGRVAHFTHSVSFRDDLTCIAVKIKSPTDSRLVHSQTLVMSSNLEDLVRLRKFIKDFCNREADLSSKFINQLELAVNEAASNIMRHAYEGLPDKQIILDARILEDRVLFELTHWGKPLSQLQISAPAFDGSQQHGFGLYLIRNCVDEVNYISDERGKSVVRLTKLLNSVK